MFPPLQPASIYSQIIPGFYLYKYAWQQSLCMNLSFETGLVFWHEGRKICRFSVFLTFFFNHSAYLCNEFHQLFLTFWQNPTSKDANITLELSYFFLSWAVIFLSTLIWAPVPQVAAPSRLSSPGWRINESLSCAAIWAALMQNLGLNNLSACPPEAGARTGCHRS